MVLKSLHAQTASIVQSVLAFVRVLEVLVTLWINKVLKVVTCNVNGIRASARKGLMQWLLELQPDFICLQETKAQMNAGLQEDFALEGYHSYFQDARKKGYSGVGIYARAKPHTVDADMGCETALQEGRYLRVSYPKAHIVSLYLPSGTSSQERQDYKMRLLEHFYTRILAKEASSTVPWVLCGDWNIAHKPIDLKNWRQNQKNSGFLPEERAWMDKVLELGWVDAFRAVNQEAGQYTWWSYRANARSNNVGWRIDYQIVSASLQAKIKRAYIVSEPRFSDHAPLVVEYDHAL